MLPHSFCCCAVLPPRSCVQANIAGVSRRERYETLPINYSRYFCFISACRKWSGWSVPRVYMYNGTTSAPPPKASGCEQRKWLLTSECSPILGQSKSPTAPPRSTQLFFFIRKLIDKQLHYKSHLSCLSHDSIKTTFFKGLAWPLHSPWCIAACTMEFNALTGVQITCGRSYEPMQGTHFRFNKMWGPTVQKGESVSEARGRNSSLYSRTIQVSGTNQTKIARDNVHNPSLAARIQYPSDSIVWEAHERSAVVPPQKTEVTARSPSASEKIV